MKSNIFVPILLLAVVAQSTLLFQEDFSEWDENNYFPYYVPESLKIFTTGDGMKFKLLPYEDNQFLGPVNHIQFYYYSIDTFDVVPGETFKLASQVSVEVYDTQWDTTNPPAWAKHVRNSNNDPRLSHCSSTLADFSTSFFAHFLLTDNTIWAYVERLPYSLSEENKYLSFGQVKFLKERNSDEVNKLTISYDPDHNVLKFFVDGEKMASFENLGVPNDDPEWRMVYKLKTGSPTIIEPKNFRVGWGCSSFMDLADFWNEDEDGTGLIKPEPDSSIFAYPNKWYAEDYDESLECFALSNYGQGGAIIMESIKLTSSVQE